MSFFDPIALEKLKVANLADLTKEQKAGKLIVSQIKMGGHDYMMWSKYDDKGIMMQRAMLRCDLVEQEDESRIKLDASLKLDTDPDDKDFL